MKRWQKKWQVTALIFAALMLWLACVVFLGTRGDFVGTPGAWLLPILIGVTAPAPCLPCRIRGIACRSRLRINCRSSSCDRDSGLEIRRAGISGPFYLWNLPALFARPAGLGDMAIGLAAPWLVLGRIRMPELAVSRLFIVWNLLGLLDLAMAVSMGAIVSALATGAAGEIPTAPMARLPLVLIPAYLVPLFAVLHLVALFQVRSLRSSRSPRH